MLTHPDPRDYDVFVGIDVDQKSYSVSYKTQEQDCYKSFKIPADPMNLHAYFKKRFHEGRVLYAYEAGPTGYHLYDVLTEQNQPCIMVHAASIQKAPKDRVKTNRVDSLKITNQLQGGQLKGIRVPSDEYRQLRHLVSLRQAYTQDLTRLKQRILSLLLFESITLPHLEGKRWSGRHIQVLKGLTLDSIRSFKLQSLLESLLFTRSKLLGVHRALRQFLKNHASIEKNIQLLQSIPGFGFVVPLYFLARVGDPSELRSVRELGSFAGLVPSEKSTGDRIQKGSITRMGDSTLRSLLVEAAWVAIRHDKELAQFFWRIRSKNQGEKGSRIAIVAVARKLTHRAHRVLKEQTPYIVH